MNSFSIFMISKYYVTKIGQKSLFQYKSITLNAFKSLDYFADFAFKASRYISNPFWTLGWVTAYTNNSISYKKKASIIFY